MPDVSNLREDGALPPTFDHVSIVDGDRVEQPGTLYRTDTVVPQHIYQDRKTMHADAVQDRASDKFAVHSFMVPDLTVRQLLPVDPHRKIARISCMSLNGIFVGTLAALANFAGTQQATTTNSFKTANGVWFISNSLNSLLAPFEYTSKAALFYTASTTGDPGACFVQCIVERFDSGTPVT